MPLVYLLCVYVGFFGVIRATIICIFYGVHVEKKKKDPNAIINSSIRLMLLIIFQQALEKSPGKNDTHDAVEIINRQVLEIIKSDFLSSTEAPI